MNNPIIRLIKAAGYSWDGLTAAWASEPAFRMDVVLFAVGSVVALWMDVSGLERAALIGSLFLVLIVEIVNTGFETTIERISAERHELSKKAKDLGSAAVFLSLLNAAAVWLLILI